ncbi:polyamine-transporting ATPase 13A2 isoform X2 [Amia ocellicauda]
MEVCGFRKVPWRVALTYVGAVLSAGLLLLLFHWYPRLALRIRCQPCPLGLATLLLVTDSHGQQSIVEVMTEEVEEGSLEQTGAEEDEWRDTVQLHTEERSVLRFYVFEGQRYVWLSRKGAFCPVSVLNEGWTCAELHGRRGGLSHEEQSAKRTLYGQNLIDVPVKSYMRLLLEEVLNPFYVFQLFSVVLWLFDHYYYYAGCILLISLASIALTLYETRKQSSTLRSMARLVVSVTVRRATGEEEVLSSEQLVPGDCVLLPPDGLLLPCDAVLLEGECMVNESMLTGESVPVMKTAVTRGEQQYCPDAHRRHTLFCGTQLIQTKGRGIVIVTRTGFCTAKGDLVSSILHPQPISFRFYSDAMKFLIVLGVLALIGTVYSVVILVQSNVTVMELVVRSLDIVTIIVPPALPAALTTGMLYAQSRLKQHGVFCVSPPRITVSGKASVICFDKTGTLTEEGLDVWGVLPRDGGGFGELVPDPRLLPPGPLLWVMASCHSVCLLGGQPLGDPLDLKMIESTGWELVESAGEGEPGTDLTMMKPPAFEQQPQGIMLSEPLLIVRRFPFSSALQRMSVVVRPKGGHGAQTLLKGAPETVASLCHRDSVPAGFSETLKQFTSEGFRVLALAHRPLELSDSELQVMEREAVESELQFLGFLVMRNLLKPETAPVITTLRSACLRTVMATGDNILTAVNVARGCGMVGGGERVIFVHATPPLGPTPPILRFVLESEDGAQGGTEALPQGLYQQGGGSYHLALTGESFSVLCDYFPEHLPKVLVRGTVFARMSPEQKTQLVRALQGINHRVLMCGDGANDCGALRAADVGVSLSEAESAVAAPFTSRTDNISCVPLLIREGRCSLVTSFALFKYMALYSIIQYSSVLILYTVKTNLSDLQFLLIDLGIVTSLAIVMGRGGPAQTLTPARPPARLLSMTVLGSLFLHTVLLLLTQTSALLITQAQDWFVPLNATVVVGAGNLPNAENTALFSVSGLQYLTMAAVLYKGPPFRCPLYTNVLFVLVFLCLLGLLCWLVLAPLPWMCRLLKLLPLDDMAFKVLLLALAALHLISAFMLEVLVDSEVLNCVQRLRGARQSKKLYKRLDLSLREQPDWPPLDQPLLTPPGTTINLS